MPEPKESDYTVVTIRLLSKNLDLLSFADAGFAAEQIALINHAVDSVAGLVIPWGRLIRVNHQRFLACYRK